MSNKVSLIEFSFIAFYVILCLSPFLNVYFSQSQIFVMEVIYTMYIAFKNERLWRISLSILLCSLVIAVLYVTTTNLVTISNVSNRNLKGLFSFTFQYYTLVFPVLFYARLRDNASKTQKMLLLIIAGTVLIATVINTLQALQVNPYLMKSQMVSDLTGEDEIIGGYFYVIAGPIWVTALFYGFYKIESKIIKILLLGLGLFFLYYVSTSGYAIAFLSCLLGVYCVLYAENEHKKLMWFILPVVIIIILPILLSLVIEMLPEESPTVGRMKELLMVSQTGNRTDTDLQIRLDLYGEGLLAFITSPIWGNYALNFNSHSTFIEILASLGILGGVALYKELKISFNILSYNRSNYKLLPFVVVFIFQGCTNPVNYSFSLAISLWLIAPLLMDVLLSNIGYEQNINNSASIQS